MKLRIICLALVFVLLGSCAALDPAKNVESLRQTIEQGEASDRETVEEKVAALYKLRALDEAACADAAYTFLTGFDYHYLGYLSYQTDPKSNTSFVHAEDILAEYFTLCEANGHPDVREAVAERVCESADAKNYGNAAKQLCGASPEFFELFLPKMIRTGWFSSGDSSAERAVSGLKINGMCETYLEDAGDALPARLAFLAREVYSLTDAYKDMDPIPWTQPVPEPSGPVVPRSAGVCYVLSRAVGYDKQDHDWQLELPVCFSLPEENRFSEDGKIDTLILLDTTWEEAGEYNSGRRAFQMVTKVSMIDPETGVLLREPETITYLQSVVVSAKESDDDIYSFRGYVYQDKLMDYLLDHLQ